MAEEDSLHRQSPSRHVQNQETIVHRIEGMESVVATVSGYHGLERFNLIRLISHAGANYTGAMSGSTTHLVCWKFEGKKYDLAKKFRTLIVNHRWVEECIKQGKRVPEHPYIWQSGLEVGPLLLEVPLTNVGASGKNKKLQFEHSNVRDHHGKEINYMDLGGSSNSVWTDSCLLKENLLPDVGKSSDIYRKSKRKATRTSKQEALSSNRSCFQEPPGLDRMEDEESSPVSLHLARRKRKISGKKSTPFAESSHKGQSVVKRNVGRDRQSLLLDSNHECYTIEADSNRYSAGHSKGARKINIQESRERFDGHCIHLETESEDEEVEETAHGDHLPTSMDSYICTEDELITLKRPFQDGVSDVKNFEGDIDPRDQLEPANISPTSTELSCVICWTDFSSIRGVLPCGHRFCYSCIQNWADHMVARRKASTCPLCKASFATIKKVEGALSSDQKIYSQTIPHSQSTIDIFIPTDGESSGFGAQSSRASVCSECRSREPEDCLISCHLCQIQCIHIYCLDPPLLPWTCIHCKDLRRLYLHNR